MPRATSHHSSASSKTPTAATPAAHADRAQAPRDGGGCPRGFGVADLCRRWKVGPDKVHTFIRRGELAAVNLATNLSARPQWRVTRESVERFEERRGSTPPPKVRRRRRQPALIDFFPD
jgi:hypothetical protein